MVFINVKMFNIFFDGVLVSGIIFKEEMLDEGKC